MPGAPYHPQEARRLDALHQLDILDSETNEAWERIVKLASIICKTPIALVSLIDEDRQWFKARVGLDAQETPREQAFCGYAILQDGIFIVDDPKRDARFSDNPLVTDGPKIRFYAGMPIHDDDGYPLGTVCVIDQKPRKLNEQQKEALHLLAADAESLIRLRGLARDLIEGVHIEEDARAVINSIAHEIMNPLTPAMLQIATMKHGADDDMGKRLLRIERNLARIRDVVKQAGKTLARET